MGRKRQDEEHVQAWAQCLTRLWTGDYPVVRRKLAAVRLFSTEISARGVASGRIAR